MADNDAGLEAAAAAIREGGLVGCPTDTLYGLAADIHNPSAVAAVLAAKGRAAAMGIPVLIADYGDLERVAAEIPPEARLLAERFWPGALTLVLKRAPGLSDALTGGPTVAVRAPNHPTPRALGRLAGRPITGTSANLHGGAPPADADEVERQLGAALAVLLDGGPAPAAQPSTIIDLTRTPARLLRRGAVPIEALRAVVEVADLVEAGR
ncbi:MAG: L-threonylcarbamoyladenylate synthase [Chloroflexota bacterium]|nr:L-threonylcarbamoyladenylate synthase [Chloroflexota bacterium]